MQQESDKKKIGTFTKSSMIGIAILFDLISVIPVINIISGFIAGLIFFIWFYTVGVSFWDGKTIASNLIRLCLYLASLVVELTSFISAIPMLTITVIIVIWMHNNATIKTLVDLTVGNTEERAKAIKNITNRTQQISNQKTNIIKEKIALESLLSNQKTQTLNDIIPIRTEQPQTPSYAKKPNKGNLPLPQQRRQPPDINPTAHYGDETGEQESQKAA